MKAVEKKTIKEKIFDLVASSLVKLKLDIGFSIDYPEHGEHGDYATNAALMASRILKRPAPEIAYEIFSNFEIDANTFEKVEVSSRGFINFFLKDSFVLEQLPQINKPSFGQSNFGGSKKINIEFISANPTGPLHLGHARGAFFGDVLSSVLELCGYDVTREYYINDAKASNQIRELGKTVLGLGQSYMSSYLDYKINEFKNRGFSFMGVNESEAGHLVAKSIQEDNRQFVEERLGIKFNKWFSEQSLYDEQFTDSVFSSLQKRGLIYENEGATWIASTKFGDVRDRVLIRSQEKGGASTYYYTDMAYYLSKCERGFSSAVYILGADHHDDAKFLEILPKLFNRSTEIKIVLTQLVTFRKENLSVKLSKRKGQVINLDWLLEQVGIDAARFFYLLKSPNTHMEFDVDLAKTKNLQNPVFYIQYTHARLHSILRKAREMDLEPEDKKINLLSDQAEIDLLKSLLRFPELVVDIARSSQVHSLPHYLINLSALINSFYEKIRVIDEKDPEKTKARLCLVEAAKSVVGKCLGLLGMTAPLKM